jgi:TolB-like protein
MVKKVFILEEKMQKIIALTILVLAAGLCFGQQPVVAVAPFEAVSGNTESDAETIAEIFAIELQQTGLVRVVSRAGFTEIMNEHKFQLGDLSSDEKTAALAKGINANWVVRGKVQKLGQMTVVTATFLDVNTIEITGGAPMYLSSIEEMPIKVIPFVSQIKESIQKFIENQQENKVYRVGDIGPAGGYIFYVKGDTSGGWRYLEVAPSSTEFTNVTWGEEGKIVWGTSEAIGSGKQNTKVILDFQRKTGYSNSAVQLCDSLSCGGYDDWFLPSKDELYLIYQNLIAKGIGDFSANFFWSSTNGLDNSAWILNIYKAEMYYSEYNTGGKRNSSNKQGRSCSVRAVRMF